MKKIIFILIFLSATIGFSESKKLDALGCTKDILKSTGKPFSCSCKAGMLYDAESGNCHIMYSDKITCLKINPPQCSCTEKNYVYQEIDKKCLFVPSHSKPIGPCNPKFAGDVCKCPSGFKLGSVEFTVGFNPKYCLRDLETTNETKKENKLNDEEDDLFAPEGSEEGFDAVFESSKVKK